MKYALLTLALFSTTLAVPYIAREPCAEDADCLHGFPATVPTLVCSKSSVCEPRNPHWCGEASDCKDALTTCVANRCVHGARGAPCTTRADCGIGLFCTTKGRCTHGIPGTECSTATAVECANGLTCGSSEKCVPGLVNERCVLDRNCADGFFCDGGRCAAGAKPAKVQFYPWGTPPPMLPPYAGFTNAVTGAGTPEMSAEPSLEPLVGMTHSAMGAGSAPVTPEPIPFDVTAPPHVSTSPELVAAPDTNNVVAVTSAPVAPDVFTVPGVGSSNVMGAVPEATVAPASVAETSVTNAQNESAAVPEPTIVPQPTQEVVELTEPLTVESLPTAIPIPNRNQLKKRKDSFPEIILRA